MKFLASVFAFSFLLLAGCANHAPKANQWPQDIPSRAFFVDSFNADLDNKKAQDLDEYLLWVYRFYKGWELYHNGWSQVTHDSLIGVNDPAAAAEIKTKMDSIGVGIACEWAKGKKDRRILTRHVVVWGNALIESMKRNEELPLINKVINDMNSLLALNIPLDDVNADRYFPKDKDDAFR